MNAANLLAATVLHADRQYIGAAQDRIAALELENSKLRACLAASEKEYAELVPLNPIAWIDQNDVDTNRDVYHVALVRFIEKNIELFYAELASQHVAWVEHENIEALIAARGEY
jgi:hypothetical protein